MPSAWRMRVAGRTTMRTLAVIAGLLVGVAAVVLVPRGLGGLLALYGVIFTAVSVVGLRYCQVAMTETGSARADAATPARTVPVSLPIGTVLATHPRRPRGPAAPHAPHQHSRRRAG